jgi:hypothetical protein
MIQQRKLFRVALDRPGESQRRDEISMQGGRCDRKRHSTLSRGSFLCERDFASGIRVERNHAPVWAIQVTHHSASVFGAGSRHRASLACLFGVILLLSSVTPVVKYVFEHSTPQPIGLACFRVMIGFVFLFAITWLWDRRGIAVLRGADLLLLGFVGFLGVFSYAIAARDLCIRASFTRSNLWPSPVLYGHVERALRKRPDEPVDMGSYSRWRAVPWPHSSLRIKRRRFNPGTCSSSYSP